MAAIYFKREQLLHNDKQIANDNTTSETWFLFFCWAEAHIQIARMTLTIKLDRNWNSFQLAGSAPPLSVTDSAIAPSSRIMTKLCHLSITCMVSKQLFALTTDTESANDE